MRVLVGLGNPGEQYDQTRHNVGFDCVDAVAKELGVTSWKQFKGGLLAKVGENYLFKPQGYMNTSGLPVRQFLDYYDIVSEDMCVVADDIYIAPGSARIRRNGADGGHNGWKSVIQHLESSDFWRVRIGAGVYEQHPEHRMHQPPLDEYVLQRMPAHDQNRTRELIDKLVPNLVRWLEQGKGLEEATIHI